MSKLFKSFPSFKMASYEQKENEDANMAAPRLAILPEKEINP